MTKSQSLSYSFNFRTEQNGIISNRKIKKVKQIIYMKRLKGVTNTVGGFEINSYLFIGSDIINKIEMKVHMKKKEKNYHQFIQTHADRTFFLFVSIFWISVHLSRGNSESMSTVGLLLCNRNKKQIRFK